MKTNQQYLIHDAREIMPQLNEQIHLVVTSPPYPMIEMWDKMFSDISPRIRETLALKKGPECYELMHRELDKVWEAMYQVLCKGGFLCINIGDATRKIGDDFQLFTNHSRITEKCLSLGFQALPSIIWWKPTNAPNKFMGSGMLPAGAYVTLEHEYILIFRKAGKREFKSPDEKKSRQESAMFWEERNQWFSDSWRISGNPQNILNPETRKRSAAFPFELAQRLVNMYSLKNEWVLDPFGGTGTTLLATTALGRNGMVWDIDRAFQKLFDENLEKNFKWVSQFNFQRLENHMAFVDEQTSMGKEFKYQNKNYAFPVKTAQEKLIQLAYPEQLKMNNSGFFEVQYHKSFKNVKKHELLFLDK